mgnify:CR=1 FL=1
MMITSILECILNFLVIRFVNNLGTLHTFNSYIILIIWIWTLLFIFLNFYSNTLVIFLRKF